MSLLICARPDCSNRVRTLHQKRFLIDTEVHWEKPVEVSNATVQSKSQWKRLRRLRNCVDICSCKDASDEMSWWRCLRSLSPGAVYGTRILRSFYVVLFLLAQKLFCEPRCRDISMHEIIIMVSDIQHLSQAQQQRVTVRPGINRFSLSGSSQNLYRPITTFYAHSTRQSTGNGWFLHHSYLLASDTVMSMTPVQTCFSLNIGIRTHLGGLELNMITALVCDTMNAFFKTKCGLPLVVDF